MPAAISELRFGRFRLDPVRRLLFVDGEPSKLDARAIGVLIALAQRRTRVVGKDESFDLAWPGLVVEEYNLQQHVSALRELLGAQAISTVPRRGDNFIAAVEDDAALPSPAADAAPRLRDNLPAVLPPLLGRADERGRGVERGRGLRMRRRRPHGRLIVAATFRRADTGRTQPDSTFAQSRSTP
jgi:DNA-binding winged helix-turn-helix (wHTH) protein